uniref:Uncharacterized protein n=1 Tax=Nothoprocta perdicaria TaxID=30464 RepID=A0A8C7EEW7_NOTPE
MFSISGTSGAFRKDLLTPDSSATMSCRGFTTGIPGTSTELRGAPGHGESRHQGHLIEGLNCAICLPLLLTCCHQLGLVFLIPHLLLLHVAAREEETHHPVEELVGELDGEGHHMVPMPCRCTSPPGPVSAPQSAP